MQLIVSCLTIRFVHDGINTPHLDISLRWLFGNLGQYSVSLTQICLDVTRRLVCIAILVSGLVIKVADVGIVCNTIIEFHNSIWWLHDVQLWIMLLVCLELHIIDVLCELVRTDQTTGIHIATSLVNTSHLHVLTQERSITLLVDACHTEVFDVRAFGSECRPLNARATVNDESCDVVRALECQISSLQLRQILQIKCLQCCRQNRFNQR